VNSIEDFVILVRDQLGLPVTAASVDEQLDRIPGWDSLQLLWLASALERSTGRPVSLPDLLEADSLGEIYQMAVAP
jgi:acyl carrier protein